MSHKFSHRLERQMLDGPTCSLEDFLRAEAEDPNFRWRIQEGHIMNLLDEALSRVAEVTAERDAARAKLAEAWREGYDDGKRVTVQLMSPTVWAEEATNPYLPPGEDAPR